MGKQTIRNNYRAECCGDSAEFYAVTDRQAWYLAYEWSDGELLDSLCEIDEYGNAIRPLMEGEDVHGI